MRMTQIEQLYAARQRSWNPVRRFRLYWRMKRIVDEVAREHPELIHDFLRYRLEKKFESQA